MRIIPEHFDVQNSFRYFDHSFHITQEEIDKFFRTTFLPYVRLKDFYFDYTKEFLQNLSGFPRFLDKNFKTVSKKWKSNSNRKVMITHDMMNGYKEDNFLTVQTPDKGFLYRFNHFMCVDIFNYFAHHYISIPPISYIKVAHSLGSQVLGTFITEYNQEKYKEILNDLDSGTPLITKLIEILKAKGFDGYLINFESNTQDIDRVFEWLNIFYSKIKQASSDYILVWYDSLTKRGFVNWQGGVNDSNVQFTKISDMFFLDYRWSK